MSGQSSAVSVESQAGRDNGAERAAGHWGARSWGSGPGSGIGQLICSVRVQYFAKIRSGSCLYQYDAKVFRNMHKAMHPRQLAL